MADTTKPAPTQDETAEDEVSEAQIAVHWREEEYFEPPAAFAAQANANDPAILERFSEERFPDCFIEYADMLTWDRKWDTLLDTSNPPFFKWFVGGRLNACVNCVDRHLETRGDKNALIWVPEPEDVEPVEITYAELHRRVNEFAALLRDFAGVKAGDRVTFHMPMVPDLPVAMLACARLGVIHSEVFGGFSGAACGQRMADAKSTVLVTMDGYYRNGDLIDHKVKADQAIEEARKEGIEVEKVLVWRRIPGEYHSESPMVEGRDYFVDDLLEDYRGQAGRARVDGRQRHAVPDVHERHHRPPEGRPALDRRLPQLRDRHVEVLPGHPSRRHVLVLRGHRVDHRPLLHRLRAAGARHDERDVRGGAHLSRSRSAVADRREARRGHLPHRADDDPDAAQGRARASRRSTATTSRR